jgi:hypothetical protein
MNGFITGDQIPRILITGSRHWVELDTIVKAIEEELLELKTRKVVVVHGDCPTGADALVERYCRTTGNLITERHPADWNIGHMAGHHRNQEMVDLGADVCLAFLMSCRSPKCTNPKFHFSHGTVDCMKRAESAAIPVREIRSKDDFNPRFGGVNLFTPDE